MTADPGSRRGRALRDIVLVIAVSLAAFMAETAAADRLPWGEEARGIIAVLAGAVTAIILTRVRGDSMAELGFTRPRRWTTVPFWALGIFFIFVLAQSAVPLMVAPLFDLPQPDMSRYDFIRGNLPAAIAMALVLPLTAAIPEEIVYRGFLIERLEHLFGNMPGSVILAVIVQSLVFGSVHFQWGLGGIIVTAIMGAVWGFAFLLCGRNLWIVIIAHSAAHVAMIMQLYLSAPP